MASAETVELRARTDEQLLSDLHEAHQALFNLRFQAATLALADVSQVRKARRRIARIHTLLRERDILEELDRELAAAGVAAPAAPPAADEEPAAELEADQSDDAATEETTAHEPVAENDDAAEDDDDDEDDGAAERED